MNGQNRSSKSKIAATLNVAVVALLALGASASFAEEPIVGLWQSKVMYDGTVLENVIAAWTADGLEFEDYALPILEGHICYGHWVKLQRRTYGQTHPYYEYDPNSGGWAGTSGVIYYTVTVSKDGKTYSGKVSGKSGVPGPDPYAAGGTSYSGLTVTATKVEVDTSQLPPT